MSKADRLHTHIVLHKFQCVYNYTLQNLSHDLIELWSFVSWLLVPAAIMYHEVHLVWSLLKLALNY